jgi:hypothetical protein
MTGPVRVLLVVTGRLEEVALADALRRLFPSAEFVTKWTDGFTSRTLPEPDPRATTSKTENLVLPRGKAKHTPPPSTDLERRRFLRERCSFHLFRPMPEALFFGDPAGLKNVGGPGAALPRVYFDAGACDIEAFVTDDPGYLTPPEGWIPTGYSAAAPWARQRRERHPKHYIEYLLDPSGTVLRPYIEKEHGARALRALDWRSVVRHADFACMVRALLDDIADMVASPLPWIASQPLHPLTCRKPGGRLRNLS